MPLTPLGKGEIARYESIFGPAKEVCRTTRTLKSNRSFACGLCPFQVPVLRRSKVSVTEHRDPLVVALEIFDALSPTLSAGHILQSLHVCCVSFVLSRPDERSRCESWSKTPETQCVTGQQKMPQGWSWMHDGLFRATARWPARCRSG